MKEILKTIVNIVHVFSFCGVIISGMLGVIYEIIGHTKFEQLLSAIGFSKGFERIWVISTIMLFLLIVTYFIKVKLFSN